MSGGTVCVLLAVALVACHRTPRPVFEYEEPVTVISTDAPGGAAPVTSTTLAPPASPWRKGSRQ